MSMAQASMARLSVSAAVAAVAAGHTPFGLSAHWRRFATRRMIRARRPRLMLDCDPKPPEETTISKGYGNKEARTQEGPRTQPSRPADKSGADGRKHASTKEAVAGRARHGRRSGDLSSAYRKTHHAVRILLSASGHTSRSRDRPGDRCGSDQADVLVRRPGRRCNVNILEDGVDVIHIQPGHDELVLVLEGKCGFRGRRRDSPSRGG